MLSSEPNPEECPSLSLGLAATDMDNNPQHSGQPLLIKKDDAGLIGKIYSYFKIMYDNFLTKVTGNKNTFAAADINEEL